MDLGTFLFLGMATWGFPKLAVSFSGPHNKDNTILGSILIEVPLLRETTN